MDNSEKLEKSGTQNTRRIQTTQKAQHNLVGFTTACAISAYHH
jgi:hypothetical protein